MSQVVSGEPLGEGDGEALAEALRLALREGESDADGEREAEPAVETDRVVERVPLGVMLGDTLAVAVADASHWQQAELSVAQFSSFSAPLVYVSGDSTSTQAPAPVGASPPVALPHRAALLA